jgi:hypothetical protein
MDGPEERIIPGKGGREGGSEGGSERGREGGNRSIYQLAHLILLTPFLLP